MESRNGNEYGNRTVIERTDTEAMEDGTLETGEGTLNRTGVATSPESALDIIREAQRTPPSSKGDARLLAEYRKPYVEEMAVIGSKPLPSDAAAAVDGVGEILLDKLGERLAFERQGVRLYECLIGKVKLLGGGPGGPSLDELEHILKEEQEHFRFLQQAILQAGGDPTVMTPCANVAGVLSQGIVQIVADPRTTVTQCLEAMLNAELADNDGWSLLQDLVMSVGAGELDDKISEAKESEAEHLLMVRGWLSALVVGDGTDPVPGNGAVKGKALKAAPPALAKARLPDAMIKPDAKPGVKAGDKPGAKTGSKPGAGPAAKVSAKTGPKLESRSKPSAKAGKSKAGKSGLAGLAGKAASKLLPKKPKRK